MIDRLEGAVGRVGPLHHVSRGAGNGRPAKRHLSPTGLRHYMAGRWQLRGDGGGDRIPALPDATLPIESGGRTVLSLDSLRH
jgi:hypothetical protein